MSGQYWPEHPAILCRWCSSKRSIPFKSSYQSSWATSTISRVVLQGTSPHKSSYIGLHVECATHNGAPEFVVWLSKDWDYNVPYRDPMNMPVQYISAGLPDFASDWHYFQEDDQLREAWFPGGVGGTAMLAVLAVLMEEPEELVFRFNEM